MAWGPDIGIQYNRNSSKDITSQLATLYTDTTLLSTGLVLYDNTGIDTTERVGEVLTPTSFNLYVEPVINTTITKFQSGGTTMWYLDSNGDLWGCGDNQYGQQGIDPATTYVSTFTKRASNVKDFTCSESTTWYIDEDDKLYGCGLNDQGQQGTGNTTNVSTFTQRGTNVADVKASGIMTWYLTKDNKLYGTGANGGGQQSTGDTTTVLNFTQRATSVASFKLPKETGAVVWYLSTSGALFGVGMNVQGNQGDGTGGTTGNYVGTFTQRATGVVDYDCTAYETWYVTTGGVLYGCGRNNSGQQGIATSTARVLTFTQRATGVKNVQCFLGTTWYTDTNDNIYSTGLNSNGQQGTGNTTNTTAFAQRATNVSKLYVGRNATWYINKSGVLYGTGVNSSGNQGSGDTTTISSFTQRATDVSDVKAVSYVLNLINYYYTTWYLTTDRKSLYGCGDNAYGQQGSGDITQVTTFTKRAL